MTVPSEEVPDDEAPVIYAVRFSTQAQQDILDATARLAELIENPGAVREWGRGVYAEAGKQLSLFPRARPVAAQETHRFGKETRRLVYRRPGSVVAYHVLYTVSEGGDDGPLVTVIHVRHGGRKPVTRDEARRILANQ